MSSSRERVLRLTKALLRKTVDNGCTAEEAASASLKAATYIEEYRLSAAELGEEAETAYGATSVLMGAGKRHPYTWSVSLANDLAKLFLCMAAFSIRQRTVVFIGEEASRTAAAEAYVYIRDNLLLQERQAFENRPDVHQDWRNFSANYRDGYSYGVQRVIQERLGTRSEKVTTLARSDESAAHAWYEQETGRQMGHSKVTAGYRRDERVFLRGVLHGVNAQIDPTRGLAHD